jgi:hypothetical protein
MMMAAASNSPFYKKDPSVVGSHHQDGNGGGGGGGGGGLRLSNITNHARELRDYSIERNDTRTRTGSSAENLIHLSVCVIEKNI